MEPEAASGEEEGARVGEAGDVDTRDGEFGDRFVCVGELGGRG